MLKTVLLCLAAVCGMLSPCGAMESFYYSARSAALGNSLLLHDGAVADIFADPAGAAGIASKEFYFLGGIPYAGLPGIRMEFGTMAFGVPFPGGVIAAGYNRFDAAGLIAEQRGTLSYAARFGAELQAGIAAKYCHHEYVTGSDALAGNDPLFSGGTGRGAMTADIGVRFFRRSIGLGIAVRNITEPDIGLKTEDKLPAEAQACALYMFPEQGIDLTGNALWKHVAAGSKEAALQYAGGVEKWFGNGTFAVRLGMMQDAVTGGIGVLWHNLSIDYAAVMNLHLNGDNSGTHLIGIAGRFGAGEGER